MAHKLTHQGNDDTSLLFFKMQAEILTFRL